ncbi:hypothetical protein [uncultured Mitsuokella sp.]|uniref:hypothetical protein n=1 Tax=uncultured Mitsuokella sp. TaxID=453120 RepID=UPI0025CD6AEA|nr:hypothetical protein [uncultured Mitsuokella sp.]
MQLDELTVIIGVVGGGGIIGILAACFRGVTYISTNVVSPVKQTVGQLEEVTRELRSWMEELRRESRDQDKRLAIVEKTLEAEHRRIDELEKEVMKSER